MKRSDQIFPAIFSACAFCVSPSALWSFDADVYRAQAALNQIGYDAGAEDGLWGRNTQRALNEFFAIQGGSFDGSITNSVLRDLGATLNKLVSQPTGLVGPISTVTRALPSTHHEPDATVAEIFAGYRTFLNGDFDFPTLHLEPADFDVRAFEGESKTDRDGYYLRTMIQYGDYGDLDGDGDNDLALGGWVFTGNENAPARLHFLKFDGGFPTYTESTSIGGTSAPWVYDFDDDGTDEVLSVGFFDGPVNPTETYYFSDGFSSKAVIGGIIDSHESNIVDFDGDGDMDVIAATYGTRDPTGQSYQPPSVYVNSNGNFEQRDLRFQGAGRVNGSSIEAADFDADGDLDYVFGDFESDVAPGAVVVLFSSGGSDPTRVAIERVEVLSRGYFAGREFRNVPIVNRTLGHSHDILIEAGDLDNDGDLDLVVSTILWSQQTNFGVYQIFVNDGHGNFRNETDKRLFNFQMSGGGSAHTLSLVDINRDGYLDIIGSDREQWNAEFFEAGLQYDFSKITGGNKLLINDGTGHFVSAHQSIFSDFSVREDWANSWFPVENPDGSFSFVSLFRTADEQNDFWQVARLKTLSTGPNFEDPAALGVPNFNEFFVLRTNLWARNSVLCGQYASALDWYIVEQPNIPINADQARIWSGPKDWEPHRGADLECNYFQHEGDKEHTTVFRLEFGDATPLITPESLKRDEQESEKQRVAQLCPNNPAACSVAELCEFATQQGIGGKLSWSYLEKFVGFVSEAKERGLDCLDASKLDVALRDEAAFKCSADIASCTPEQICLGATYLGSDGSSRWRSSSVSSELVSHAKAAQLACGVAAQ